MQYFYSLLLFFAMVHLLFNAYSLSNVELVFFFGKFQLHVSDKGCSSEKTL